MASENTETDKRPTADPAENNAFFPSPYSLEQFTSAFIPGGHGAIIGLPESEDVKRVLEWAMKSEKYVISLCHGPASLLSASIGKKKEDFLYKGYKICVFPEAIDKKNPDIGYMPGPMPWFIGEKLRELGVEIVNSDITGKTIRDRKLTKIRLRSAGLLRGPWLPISLVTES